MSELEPTRTYSNHTAPKILRRLLDELGVEYDTDDEDGCEFTEWVANGLEWEADSRGELVSLMPVMLITPEQAIAATLGTGTCHDKNGFDRQVGFECTACGTMVDSYMVTPLDTGHEVQFRYCPFCGGKVVIA